MKKIASIIKKQQQAEIEKHVAAANAPVLTDEELSDIDSFLEALDAAIMDGRDQSRNVESDGFHPSSLGIAHGLCARRNVYLLQGVAKESRVNSRVLRIFANGHDVHERLQGYMEKMGVDMQSEIVIDYDTPPIKGHADGVLEWRGRRILIEIKSCSADVYMNRLKWKKPKDEHYDQANIYAYILGLDIVWIIYENKSSQEIKIFEKKASKEKAEKIIDDWHAQWLVFQEGKLPKRPYKPDSPKCAGCDMKTHCFADPEIGIDIKPYKKKVKEMRDEEYAEEF